MSTLGKQHLYEFGPFRLDTEEGQLLHDGEPVPLTHKAFEMLRVLVENNGHVVAKDDFLNKIWPETFIEEGILTVNIANLRKVLGDDRSAHRYIETVPRRGYRFIASVRDVQLESADLAVKEPSSINVTTEAKDKSRWVELASQSQSPGIKLSWWRRPVIWVAIPMLLAGAVVLSYIRIRNKPSPTNPLFVRSIAVLPFKPLVSGSHDEALELGMADTLITK